MPLTNVDYSKTIIYKIQHKEIDELLYVGSTTDFTRRKAKHKYVCYNADRKIHNSKLYQLIRDNGGWDAFNMTIIKEFPCQNKQEALAEEDRLMREMMSTLNTRRAYITPEERVEQHKQWRLENKDKIKQWRLEHKDELAEQHKQWRLENKDKLAEQHKQWRLEHKDELAEYKKIYRELYKDKIAEQQRKWRENNKDIIKVKKQNYHELNIDSIKVKKREYYNKNKNHINKKASEYYQQNKEKLTEQNKQYRELNKLKLKEKQKEYRINNRDALFKQFICDCGGTYVHKNKSRHIKTKIHQNFLLHSQ